MKVLMIDYAMPRNKYSDGLCNSLNRKTDLRIMIDRKDGIDFQPEYKVKPVLYNGGSSKALAPVVYLFSLIKVFSTILWGHYDIVHVQTFKNTRIEMKIYQIIHHCCGKLVYTAHNVLPHEIEAFNRKQYQQFYDSCDAIIVHNHYSKDLLKKEFGISDQKVTVIPRGIYRVENGLEQVSNDNGKQNYLFFGKIRKYKGLDILLRAISLVPLEHRAHMRFIIAGEQFTSLDDTDYREIIDNLNINDSVVFRPERISNEEKDKLFNSATACICPYKEIYGSGVLLEAYTHRCPVICSDIPVFMEDTDNGKTGMLFKSLDAEDLAKKIIEFSQIGEGKRKQYVRNIDAVIKDKYNWDRAADLTLSVYKR